MWLCQHFLWDSHHLSLSVPILPPSLLPSHVLSGVRCQCRCNHLRWVAVVCQNLKDHFDSICHSGGKFDIHMPCDNSLDITASDRGTQLWTSILFFFFFVPVVWVQQQRLVMYENSYRCICRKCTQLTEHTESIVHGDHDDISIGCKDAPVKHVPWALHVRASMNEKHHWFLAAVPNICKAHTQWFNIQDHSEKL